MDGVGHVAGLDAARCTGPSGSTEVTATPAGLRLRDERSFGLRQAQAVSNISRDLLDGRAGRRDTHAWRIRSAGSGRRPAVKQG